MAKKARVTIKDVAKAANVTPQTVSRAFRNTHDISETTRKRILEIANEMGYVKNASATSLRNGSSHMIAVVYDNLKNCYFSIITDYIQMALKECGYSMMAISVADTHLNTDAYLSAVSHNADGIISFLEPRSEISNLVKNYNVPVLLFGRRTSVKGVDYIHTDDKMAGQIAAEKLLEKGCRNFLCITEALEISCAYDRCSGFCERLEAQGIKTRFIINPLGKILSVEPELIAMANSAEGCPDGIFCFNDMIAFETLYVIEKNGLPPAKIIGFDNVQKEIYLPRRLTTIGTDKQAMAKKAADMIISRIVDSETNCISSKENVFIVDGTTA